MERLEGDEVDVFSLNTINQQLPAHPKAVVPLAQATLDSQDRLTIPYGYQTNRIASTSSRNYVFYATSPNADVLSPYLEYCANKDDPEKLARFGILFTSSYSLLRVYRVSAFRRCGAYSCGADLTRFVTFDGFSRTFGRECDEVFNVSVSALEYLNEDNIAVTLESSPVTAWDVQTGSFERAKRTTYWLNPATMRVRRTVWQADPASSGIPTQIPPLCPALQRLPRVGTFAAELLNAGVFLLKYVTYVVTYTPGLVAVWRSSGGARCPAPGSAMHHSVLANCGERVYSLDDFFDSLDDAGAVFWHGLSLVARLIAPASHPEIARPLTNVLDGMSQYGQGAVDVWAGGAGVLALTRVPIREQAMQVWATVQAGTAGDGARMVVGLSSPAAGLLAWSRFSYRLFSQVGLDLLKRFLDPLRDVTLAGAFTLFWADLYDLRDEFSATVTARMRLACGGIKVMFGVDNPWANLLYHQCAAGAELGDNMLRLALDIFVQIPMAKCVCKDVSGRSVPSVVTRTCAPPLPVSLLPTLYTIANELTGSLPVRTMACERVLETVKGAVSAALDPFFAHQFQAMDALGSSVEYVTATYDADAGRCLDFQNDPHVVVIVPQPVDYFHRCAGTSLCRQTCSAEWRAFQAADAARGRRAPDTVTVRMESLFFPGELDEDLMLTNVSASVELPPGLGGCLLRAGSHQQDFALAVAEVSAADVRVQFWCAPQIPSSSVYRGDRPGFGPLTVPGSLLDLQFGDDTGAWLAALSQVGERQSVFLLNSSGVFEAPLVVDALLGDGNTLLRLENMWLVEGFILVDVLARRLVAFTDPKTGRQTAESEAVSLHMALLPPLGTGLAPYGVWRTTDVDLLRFGRGDYWYSRLASGHHLFLPKTPGLNAARARLARVGDRLAQQAMEILDPPALPAMDGASLAARSQGADYVFATSRTGWDWLRQVRVSVQGSVDGVFGSAGVQYSVDIQGTCNELGCDGCANVQVQRLCQAYQKCALINCVGTPVHQRRPLCGIGGLLRQTGRLGLLSTQGAWSIFTEMLTLALRLSLLNLKEAYLLWPEDQFLCYMCQAKDSSAEFFSILTATVNAALQLGRADLGYMYGGASNVDTNADAVLTISTTAINAFMHQLALLPLYGLAVSHQILMCQVSGVIALAPTGSFSVSIRMGKDTPAGDLIAGQCLTLGAEVLASFPKDDTPSLGAAVTSLVSNALERLLIAQIEPLLHMMDGFLAYLIGAGKALGTLVQSQNMARCSPPEFFLKDVVRCACGDHELQIPGQRRAEGLQDGALWCTGVLGMLDSNNQPYYVHNPYTYAELQARSSELQAYTECVGRGTAGYQCAPPNDPVFANQGVTTINVLVKCRENFIKKRWDPSAYMLFQPASWDLVEFQGDPAIPAGVALNISQCLSAGDSSSGSLVQRCHEEYLLDAGVSSEAYWQYERLATERAGRPENTDACLVFSGPADKGLPVFEACVDGMERAGGCTLPAHLWSPLSDNDVPLATQHRVLSHGIHRDGLVQALYAQARAEVMDAIQASLAAWNSSAGNPEVNAEFFSAEGDVLHQTMDCMFMGPYSRVDYWPIPACSEGEECLRGPFWSRDEDEGGQRHVDPSTCAAPSSLPYTCGSAGRRSLMRYLVLQLLPGGSGLPNQNVSNVGAIVRATLQHLAGLWGDTAKFGCGCADGSASPVCCATNLSSPLLPEHLRQPYTSIRAEAVLGALQDDMAALYDLALESRHAWNWFMQDVAPAETQAYDWSGSKRAEEEAFFDPTEATASYTAKAEAMSPLLEEDSTLWDVCHAALKQVFFTLPTDSDGKVRFAAGDEYDGDPARLEEFVSRFTEEAFLHSPLFRHYSPRHAPSESQMCAQAQFDDGGQQGQVEYSAFVQAGQTLLSPGDLPPGRARHPLMFRVGDESCLCGWRRAAGRCILPTQDNTLQKVCALLSGRCASDGSYAIEDEPAVLAGFSADWHCPESELSAHWGFLDPDANEKWLGLNQTSNLVTSSRDLYRNGRAGLRAGNLRVLPDLAKQYVNPSTRQVPLARGRLTTCSPPPPVEDLLRPFLDQLFPAAQAVEEPGALAYCLRYAIELARLRVFQLLDVPELEDRMAAQTELAERWRKRCGTQLHLLHVCVSLGAFKPLTDPQAKDPVACPHFRLGSIPAGRVVYTTPACLVSVDGVFYDPCRAIPCRGTETMRTVTLQEILQGGDAWRIRFDPRSLLRRGAPVGWIDGMPPLPDPEDALLDHAFARQVLEKQDATGNTEGGAAWWSAEGPMDQNSEFCDGVLDWWPDEWDFPVGYHVTVPCEANETAYRGFAQAFALDEARNELVYQHDLLRDASLVDSHFGGAGLCRAGSFGMPMPETNNMRYCTRIPLEDAEDFTLPPHTRPPMAQWTEWACTDSSSELPWPSLSAERAEYQSSRFSVGTIPNMPPETARTYPANHEAMFNLGPWHEVEAAGGSWAPRCQDFSMLWCASSAACPAGYRCRGLVCLNDPSRECSQDSACPGSLCRGVCVDPAVECIRHRDCPAERMCSGVGTCMQPTLSVQNRLPDESISLGFATRGTDCGANARNFSLLQASYWGNTGQDLLRVHGMCSFEDWFKYTSIYATPACSAPERNGTRRLDPEQCQMVDLEQPDANQSKWWPRGNDRPELMFMRPTLCDRDYERLEGFTQCAPQQGQATLLTNGGIWASSVLEYDRFARLHSSLGVRAIMLAEMDEINKTRTGFLGMGSELDGLDGLAANPFIACGGVGQCYPPRFTVNGSQVQRTVRSSSPPYAWLNYSDRDTFTCGSFGILTAQGCEIDLDRFPLYRLLCLDRVASCRVFDEISIARACASIQREYSASNQDRVAVLQGLRELFYVLPVFTTLDVYLQVTACVSDLYAAHSQRVLESPGFMGFGFYFPFMYTLYEIPFDWFYQCIVMSGMRIRPDQHALQNCQAYATRELHSRGNYQALSTGGDTLQTYLQHVRAGYLSRDIAAYASEHLAVAQRTLASVRANLTRAMFSGAADLSYPRCSKNIVWRVGPHGNPYDDLGYAPEQRAVIWNWHDTQSCSLHWHEKLLDRLELTGINRDSWIEALTDYDPVNLEQQDGAGASTLVAAAVDAMLSALKVESLQVVTSQTTGALRFRNQPPPAYDAMARPLHPSLVPRMSTKDGTTEMDETVPRTCVFLPSYDPAFARLPEYGTTACGTPQNRTVGTRVDLLRTCGKADCSSVPAYYRRNGRFNCRYVANAIISSGACTEANPGCEAAIMEQIYTALLIGYREATPVDPPIMVPGPFPWFDVRPWAFEAVDLSRVLDYERNIQPDPQRAVMCEISVNEEQAVRFTTCNHPHYQRLKQHANLHYKHDGGVSIPPRAQLEWPVDRSVLARGFMLYYANTNRSLRKRYMDGLFDDETVCKGDPAQHVCRKEAGSSQRFRSLNPWLLGNFNPYEACDVDFTSPGQGSREYIYTYCLQSNSNCKAYYERAPNTCKDKHRRLVQQVGVPRTDDTGRFSEYNLCFHKVEEDDDGCMHDQGLLGGFDGLPVASPPETSVNMLVDTKYASSEKYSVAPHLYANSEWSIPADFEAGMYTGTNPLWAGADAPYGFLRVNENDIGGHRIGVGVSRGNESDLISAMYIERLALGVDDTTRLLDDSATGVHVREWVPTLQATMAAEDSAVKRLYEARHLVRDLSPSCPLQRWTFYSGGYPGFSPGLPAAKRAQHMFHRVHGGVLAHPTMLPNPAGQFLGKYRSSNGFCACPVVQDIPQVQCLMPIQSAHPCSLDATMRSLRGALGEVTSVVFNPINNEKATRPCRMQFDWPQVDATLRDQTTVTGEWSAASSPSHRECHVLDRFRPFQYKFQAAPSLKDSGKNTVRDGACKTRRLASLQDLPSLPPFSRCVVDTVFDASVLLVCNTTTATFALPRRSRLSLPEVLARRASRRVPCSQCARPPAFRSEQGRPIPAESSFGRLHRTSPERLLAADLRKALCPPNSTRQCPRWNETSWRREAFMRNYLHAPHLLFLTNRTLPAARNASLPREDPALWTSKPWVYCPTARALRTGEGCQGTMTRADWERSKTTLCPRMVQSYSTRVLNGTGGGDPMARTTFCPIDNTTDRVCQAIAKARELVTQANCIARGDPECMPSPFVYHPASYEPSNNAWVHDSVKAFYSRIDAGACPHNTSTDAALAQFARAYQRSCPANGVNIFVGVLRAVRVVVVDVVLLTTTVIGMGFRTLQLLSTSDRAATRAQIGRNWAYIRSKARETLNTVGDLLVDTLLNSGEVGERIVAFLHKACGGLNAAVDWLLNVWCNYIQQYTMQFLAGIRKLLGITGAGFDILQDFMDEVFQGILPAAFVAKYATGGNFQNMLSEFYSQPGKRKKNKVVVNGVQVVVDSVPDSANPKQVSRSAAQKSLVSRVFGAVGRPFRAIAKAGAFVGGALLGLDLIQGIISLVEEERLRKLYPENFTLFDLSDIANVVDDLEEFILSPVSQQTCASFRLLKKADQNRQVFPCVDLSLSRYTSTSEGTTSIQPTMCWANAAPSLGQNSMFSCTASSTCRPAPGSTEFVLCATCPDPVMPGVNKYGCDGLQLQCACSTLRVTHTSCAANRECVRDGTECELRSSISPVSYGTIPCANCPSTARLICALPPTGMPARCTCMLAGSPTYDLCNDRTGARTQVDSTRLCGYLHNRRDDDPWAFDMDDLIMLPCAQVSTGVCSDVFVAGQRSRMVVAESLRLASGGGRRLLSEEEVAPDPSPPVYDAYESEYELADTKALHALLSAPGWNTTAAPCSTLALAYQAGAPPLSLLETHVLHTCGFWRYVGRRVLARHNLTAALAGHETFLLSMDDLVYAAMSPGVGLALLRSPGVFVSALMHHPWMKPVRALGVAIANQLEYLAWIRTIDSDVHEALFGDLSPEEAARQGRQEALQRIQERISPRMRPAKQAPPSRASAPAPKKGPSRRLLTAEDVFAYSARIIQNPDSAGFLPQRVAGAWSTADFVWPPRYNYTLAACPIGMSALDLAVQVALINKVYFANFDKRPPPVDRSLRGNLPDFSWATNATDRVAAAFQSHNTSSSWASTAFRWMLGLAGISPELLVRFFTSDQKWSLTWLTVSLTQCDLASTLTCARRDKDLVMSTVVFILMYLALNLVAGALGWGFLATLFLLSYPWFILWYVFGMAPSCTPLIPTCLLADVIAAVESVLPRQILFPPDLVCDANQTCLRSCTELDFVAWADPLAFAVCDTDLRVCRHLQTLPGTGIAILDDLLWTPAREAMARFSNIIQRGDDLAGHRLCTWVSFITSVPVIALIGSFALVSGALVAAVMDMLPPMISLVCQAAVFYEA